MQGCIFSKKKVKTFPEPIFERKKLFQSFRKDLVTFGKVFVIFRWNFLYKLSDFGNFQNQKKDYFGKYSSLKI